MTPAAAGTPAGRAAPAGAAELHAAVHRPLRALLADALARLGWADPGDAVDAAAVADRLDTALALCRRRLQCEREVVHAAVEARWPGASQSAGAAHDEQLDEIADLQADAARLRAAPGGAHALRLYRRLALFVAATFDGMDAAEAGHAALLGEAGGAAGVGAVAARLLAAFDDGERALLRRWSVAPGVPEAAAAWDTGGPQARTHREGARMILEIADIRIQPGRNAEFEAAIQHALATVASQAQGFRNAKVNRGVESPERYVLMIYWETLEDHTVAFRQGPLFAQWRGIIGPFFAQPPAVEHFTLAHET